MYVCIYIYIYISTHVHIYICIYMCICTYTMYNKPYGDLVTIPPTIISDKQLFYLMLYLARGVNFKGLFEIQMFVLKL